MKKKKYKPRKKNCIKKEVVNSQQESDEVKETFSMNRTKKPAQWLYVSFSDGKIYKIAAERIAEMKVKNENGQASPTESTQTREVFNKQVQEMLHFPYMLIDWMEKKLGWPDLVTFVMQTYASKPIDPVQEWKTCPKGVLFEGDEL